MLKPGRSLKFAAVMSWLILQPGCVSVQLGPKGPDLAKSVRYAAPGQPFQEFNLQDVDKAWKNSKNGNSIAYRSACNDPVETELDSLQQAIMEGLDSAKLETNERTAFNGRDALHSVVQGKLDGVATKIELMIFKKNNCTYTLTYVALPKNFATDQSAFQQFLKSFEAP